MTFQASLRPQMKKALRGCARLSLVDYMIELSNLDLVKDMMEVIDFLSEL